MKSHFPPFGPILRQFRQAKELSQEELAALLDISPSYISRLEMIFRLAGALKVNPHELIKAMEN